VNPLKIGNIKSLVGNTVEVFIRDDIENMYLPYKGKLYSIGQLGSYVIIPVAYEKIVGIVTQIQMQEIQLKDDTIIPSNRKIMTIQIVGRIKDNKFERGITSYPLVGEDVCLADENDIEIIFSQKETITSSIKIGYFSQNENIDVWVDINKLLSRHLAIVGSTGSGKSTTVTTLINCLIEKYDHPHILLFDIHGEYAQTEALRNNDAVNIINGHDVNIPYWLLTYQEWLSLLLAHDSKQQSKEIREGLMYAKKKTVNEIREFKKYEKILKLNTPIPFSLDNFREKIQEKYLKPRMDNLCDDKRYYFLLRPDNINLKLDAFIERLIQPNKKVNIIDLSMVPSDILPIIISLLSRSVFDFNYWNLERDFPICLMFEESHLYLGNTGSPMAKWTIERIAKEGRKYAVSIAIISQRPSEVSQTILSQCNNFISHRLTTDIDQKYVQSLLSDTIQGLTNLLPTLITGEAIIVGDAVSIPVRAKIKMAFNLVSSDCDYDTLWKTGPDKNFNIPFIIENIITQEYRKRQKEP